MKISIDKTEKPDELVFTITVLHDQDIRFDGTDLRTLQALEVCKRAIEQLNHPEKITVDDALLGIQAIREKAFKRCIAQIKFAITNTLEEKFVPMCQEIYNWYYGRQRGDVKHWLNEFDAERTYNYFDNDVRKARAEEGYDD